MPKTKFQEFIFTLITSGCIIFINGTADEPAWNHRIFRNHFKSHLHLAPDHLPELHHSLPTADPGCRTILQIRIPSPVRISKSGK